MGMFAKVLLSYIHIGQITVQKKNFFFQISDHKINILHKTLITNSVCLHKDYRDFF